MGRIALLSVPIILVAGLSLTLSQEYNTPLCSSSWQIYSNLKDKVKNLASTPQVTKYQYAGVVRRFGDAFSASLCSDVTRIAANITVSSIDLHKAANESSTAEATVTAQLKNLIATMETTDPSLNFMFASYSAKLQAALTSPDVAFTIEFILKGQDTNYLSSVTSAFTSATTDSSNNRVLPGVGPLVGQVKFQMMTCSESPPSAPANGNSSWDSTSYFPGYTVSYACVFGYYLVNEDGRSSTCNHDTLEWSKSAKPLECKPGCRDSPPSPPSNAVYNYTYVQETGTVLEYTCRKGYRNDFYTRVTSTCKDGTWTTFPDSFYCMEITCSRFIPQVPAFASSTFTNNERWMFSLPIGFQVNYTCNQNYVTNYTLPIMVMCLENGTWSPLPSGFMCINLATAYREHFLQTEEGKRYLEIQASLLKVATENYFIIVTIPSMAGLILLILLCMCISRTDSPLFSICGDQMKPKYQKV